MNSVNSQAYSFHTQDMSSTRPHPVAGRASDRINVADGVIYWPDNGWYEVQFADSYNTVSEGGQSAFVGAGTYNVINHTTGERFENIVVGHDIGWASQQSSLDTLRDSPTTADRLSRSGTMNYGPGGIRDLGAEPSTITTIAPESNWPEVLTDAGQTGAGAAVVSWRAGMRHPLVLAEAAVGAAALSLLNNVEINTVPNPSNIESNRQESNRQGVVSSAESAEAGRFGTNPEGEFGGTPVAPVPEPASQPTAPSRTPIGNRNTDGESNSRGGGSSMSSRESAVSGGYGTSEGGEFG